MGKEKKTQLDEPIYDAKVLGTPKMLVLGLQHLFAMFGATVLVPILTGLSVSATLLFAGLATLFMHLVTGKKVPVFLESTITEIKDKTIVIRGKDGKVTEVEYDDIVNGIGFVPTPVGAKGPHIHRVGDCVAIGNLRTAIWRAWDVAMLI